MTINDDLDTGTDLDPELDHGSGTVMRPFAQSLPMALPRAREAAMRLFRPMLAEHDLTEQQWRVLRALTVSHDGVEVGSLAGQTFLLAPSLSRILSNLEGRELIHRAPVAHDQRRATITLSAAGHQLVEQVAPRSEATYNLIEQEFGAERLSRLLDELHQLAGLDGNH